MISIYTLSFVHTNPQFSFNIVVYQRYLNLHMTLKAEDTINFQYNDVKTTNRLSRISVTDNN